MDKSQLATTATIYCIGLSHRVTPVELRESVNDPKIEWGKLLQREFPEVDEWFLLCTCNRFELYLTFNNDLPDITNLKPRLEEFVCVAANDHRSALVGHYRHYVDRDAVTHMCRVACGLDSMVLGESEILGQLTDAFVAAIEAKNIGLVLSTVIRTAIRAGKRARTETEIGMKAASVSSLAISLAESTVGDLRDQRVLVIGTGQIGMVTLRALYARRLPNVSIINRTFERAQSALMDPQWQAYPLSLLAEEVGRANVIFTATSSSRPIITYDMVHARFRAKGRHYVPNAIAQAMSDTAGTVPNNNRANGAARSPAQDSLMPTPETRIVFIDLAVPRDVESQVSQLPHVSLIDIDNLEANLDKALGVRTRAIPNVTSIIQQEIEHFDGALRELAIRPVVVDFRQRAELIRQQELARSRRYLRDVDPEVWEQVEYLSRSLVNKLLHHPTVHIREKSHDTDSEQFAATVRELFDLPLDHQTDEYPSDDL